MDNTIEIKQAYRPSQLVESINSKMAAAAAYTTAHEEWEIDCTVAKKAGALVPEEPQKNQDAIRGEQLNEMKRRCRDEANSALDKAFTGDHGEVESLIARILWVNDGEERTVQAGGIALALAKRTNPERWGDLCTVVTGCADALGFGAAEPIYEGAIRENERDGAFKANTSVITVLTVVASEKSPLAERYKTIARFLANEGEGMQMYKTAGEYQAGASGINKERLGMLLGEVGKQSSVVTALEILKETSFDQDRLAKVMAKLSQGEGVEVETRERLQGMTLGYVEAMLNSRPDYRGPGQARYQAVSMAAAEALLGLIPPGESFYRFINNRNYDRFSLEEEVWSLYSQCNTDEVESMMKSNDQGVVARRHAEEEKQKADAAVAAAEAERAQSQAAALQVQAEAVASPAVEAPVEPVSNSETPAEEPKKTGFWGRLFRSK